MGKQEKLVRRLCSRPKDFTWKELKTVMQHLGFVEDHVGKKSGSRVRFISQYHAPIILHKPHPTTILKQYQIRLIINHLYQEGLL